MAASTEDLLTGRWRVHMVRQGDAYGLDDCLVHEKPGTAEWLVEFYDMSIRERDPKGWPEGQFVSRYCLGTLLNLDGYYGDRSVLDHPERGRLALDGGSPEWTIAGEDYEQFSSWVSELVAADQKSEYMLLDRLRQDCNYFLGFGHHSEHALWSTDGVEGQIAKMRELYDGLLIKPDWCSPALIDDYESYMLPFSREALATQDENGDLILDGLRVHLVTYPEGQGRGEDDSDKALLHIIELYDTSAEASPWPGGRFVMATYVGAQLDLPADVGLAETRMDSPRLPLAYDDQVKVEAWLEGKVRGMQGHVFTSLVSCRDRLDYDEPQFWGSSAVAGMRDIYDRLVYKPTSITSETIDAYAQSLSPVQEQDHVQSGDQGIRR